MKKAIVIIGLVGAILAVLLIGGVYAQGPGTSPPHLEGQINASDDTIDFQGRLYDSTGTPVAAGNYDMRFTVCTDVNCASPPAWGPSQFTAAVDAEGLFNVLLSGLDADDFVSDRWLRIEVWTGSGWDDMTPYQPMTSVAISIGNIRKNVPDTSVAAYDAGFILEIENTGAGAGLWGHAPDAIGVRGDSTTDTGVVGTSSSFWGVYGLSTSGQGVHGYASGATTYGVIGHAETGTYYTPSGRSAGLVGSASTAGDMAVFAMNSDLTGDSYGLVGAIGTSFYLPPTGVSAALIGGVGTAGDYGIYGVNGSTTTGYGVLGASYGTAAINAGVMGRNYATTGQGFGVVGMASTTTFNYPSSGSVSVLASANRSGDIAAFVANSATSNARGVIGMANATSYYTPLGGSTAVSGNVSGLNDWGVMGSNPNTSDGIGTYGWGWVGVYGDCTYDATGWAGYFHGWLGSQFLYAGNYSLGVEAGGENRTFNTMASPESWFEDFGTATLVDGRAIVEIEPLFAGTVNLAEDYHVFLTPLGNCNGLYVSAKTSTSFEVHELGGGKANISFDYRIVAKRAGYEGQRMELLSRRVPAEMRSSVLGIEELSIQEVTAQQKSPAVQHTVEPVEPR